MIWLVLILFGLLQRVGQSTFDTKFDLTADPGAFLARSLHLWNPQSSFGELQNQAYGYLFPQGAFFVALSGLGVSDWVAQRLWSIGLLLVAYEGARRLWRALSPEASGWTGLVAGLAFAASPRLLGLSGVLSAEVLPTAVLPFVVLPLVLGLRQVWGYRSAALWSAVAVLFLGGVNAVEDLAVLPLPFLLVAWSWREQHARLLLRWWLGAVTVASAWWLLPLIVLGKYSPPFLDYIETSSAVVRPLGWTNATRGADHWLAFLNVGGRPWWPGAFDLAALPALVAATAVVAGIGVIGLSRARMPLRGPLVASVLLGLVCLTVARDSALEGPLQTWVQHLLDGPLSMLRNVHKVDPLIRLPLALGIAQAVSELARWRVADRRRGVLRVAALSTALAMLAITALPMVQGRLRKPGWDEVPQAWSEAAAYLDAHDDGSRTLILPGSGFGQQWWGWTIDEPFQGVASTPWVTRSQIPLTPGPTIRMLDSLEEKITDGVGSARLSQALARAGIGWVLVRRDLDLFATSAPPPARVDLAIAASPGLERVASFGKSGFGDEALIDVFAVRAPHPVVEAVSTRAIKTLAGGPEDILSALEAGTLRPQEPVRVIAQPSADDRPDIVADGYRLRERQFGRLHDSVSQIMATTEPYRTKRPAHDYPGVDGVPRIAAEYSGLAAVTASTSGGYVDTLGPVRPERGPYSAFDGVVETYWQSVPFEDPTDQWVAARLAAPYPLRRLSVTVSTDGVLGVPIRQIAVTAGTQRQVLDVDPETGVVPVRLSGQPVSSVRIDVERVAGATGVVAIRDVELDGLAVSRRLVVPDVEAGSQTSFIFRARPHRRGCLQTLFGPSCDRETGRVSEEERGLFRSFTLGEYGSWAIRGNLTALPTSATQKLLEPFLIGEARVRASSVYANEPTVSGQLAFDNNPATSWVAEPGAEAPQLFVQLPERRTITGLRIVRPTGNAVGPASAVLTVDGQQQEVDLDSSAFGVITPFTARKFRITFAGTGDARGTPVGVGELLLEGAQDLAHPLDLSAPTGAICGIGPEVEIDGRIEPTVVTGTVGDVIAGTPLKLRTCHGPVSLTPGEHEVGVRSTEQFQVTQLVLRPEYPVAGNPATHRELDVHTWGPGLRTLDVAPGEEAVLRVAENLNEGWYAELDGRRLTRVTLDGWQQGYLLPAGDGGQVVLRFAPDRAYRGALLLGGLLALALLLGAMWSLLHDRRVAAEESSSDAADASLIGPSAAGRPGLGHRRALVGLVVSGVLGGPAVLGGFAAGHLARKVLPSPGLLAGLLVGVAGIVGALANQPVGRHPLVADLIAGMGVGLLTLAWWPRGKSASRLPDDPEPHTSGATDDD